MDGDPSARDALETLWKPRGLRVDEVSFASDGTIAGSERRAVSSRARARGALPARPADAPDEREIVLAAELGRGGMGVVHAATQRSLRREVAVKRALHPEEGSADLVEEAWALAHLAHPSVVPVHTIAYLDGTPSLVMKRVSGVPWSDVLARPAEHTTLLKDDALGFHLRTLVDVARAIEHAHDAGVLHLDLKPQNVMIGQFGEVYLLDWGLCARARSEPAWLAPASSIDSVAGTPEYMAPELAMAAGDRIDERTDVYLLGAILHEIITGQPRHAGKSPIQRLYSACLSAPPPEDARGPAELWAIVARATAREPAERHASAAELRAAIEGHLRHREADALFARAQREAEDLEAALAVTPIDSARVHAHFGGARFAVREARALRSDLPGAEALEKRLFGAMAGFALDAGEVALAEAYLRELPGGDPALERRIEEARTSAAARAAHVRRLEGLAREEDLSTGRTMRSRTTLALGAAFFCFNAGMALVERSGLHTFSYRDTFGFAVATTAVVAPWAWLRRRQLFPNRAGTGIWAVCITMLVVVQGFWAMAAALGIPFHTAVALTPVFYMLCFGALATLLDARLWPAAILQVPTAIVAARFPEHVYVIVGVGGSMSVVFLAVRWAERARATASVATRRTGAR